MNHTRFNRHEVFDTFLMDWHRTTIRSVEDFFLDNNESPFNSLTNMLNGIWDGYLYNDLLETAKQVGLPMEDIRRIESTISVIEEYIESNPNTVTKIF
jgi:hypothetical protein